MRTYLLILVISGFLMQSCSDESFIDKFGEEGKSLILINIPSGYTKNSDKAKIKGVFYELDRLKVFKFNPNSDYVFFATFWDKDIINPPNIKGFNLKLSEPKSFKSLEQLATHSILVIGKSWPENHRDSSFIPAFQFAALETLITNNTEFINNNHFERIQIINISSWNNHPVYHIWHESNKDNQQLLNIFPNTRHLITKNNGLSGLQYIGNDTVRKINGFYVKVAQYYTSGELDNLNENLRETDIGSVVLKTYRDDTLYLKIRKDVLQKSDHKISSIQFGNVSSKKRGDLTNFLDVGKNELVKEIFGIRLFENLDISVNVGIREDDPILGEHEFHVITKPVKIRIGNGWHGIWVEYILPVLRVLGALALLTLLFFALRFIFYKFLLPAFIYTSKLIKIALVYIFQKLKLFFLWFYSHFDVDYQDHITLKDSLNNIYLFNLHYLNFKNYYIAVHIKKYGHTNFIIIDSNAEKIIKVEFVDKQYMEQIIKFKLSDIKRKKDFQNLSNHAFYYKETAFFNLNNVDHQGIIRIKRFKKIKFNILYHDDIGKGQNISVEEISYTHDYSNILFRHLLNYPKIPRRAILVEFLENIDDAGEKFTITGMKICNDKTIKKVYGISDPFRYDMPVQMTFQFEDYKDNARRFAMKLIKLMNGFKAKDLILKFDNNGSDEFKSDLIQILSGSHNYNISDLIDIPVKSPLQLAIAQPSYYVILRHFYLRFIKYKLYDPHKLKKMPTEEPERKIILPIFDSNKHWQLVLSLTDKIEGFYRAGAKNDLIKPNILKLDLKSERFISLESSDTFNFFKITRN